MAKPSERHCATASVTVLKYDSSGRDAAAEKPILTAIRIEEAFAGDILALGVAEALQATHPDGSAGFVGVQRVVGTVAGRTGEFLLRHVGAVEDDRIHGAWTVVPDSGTDGLTGLRGRGGFQGHLGQGPQAWFEHWFEHWFV